MHGCILSKGFLESLSLKQDTLRFLHLHWVLFAWRGFEEHLGFSGLANQQPWAGRDLS